MVVTSGAWTFTWFFLDRNLLSVTIDYRRNPKNPKRFSSQIGILPIWTHILGRFLRYKFLWWKIFNFKMRSKSQRLADFCESGFWLAQIILKILGLSEFDKYSWAYLIRPRWFKCYSRTLNSYHTNHITQIWSQTFC